MSSDKLMNERMLFAFQHIIGQTVVVQTKTGSVYQGIFHTCNLKNQQLAEVVLKLAYTVHEGAAGSKTAPAPLTAGEVDGRPFRPRVAPLQELVIGANDFAQVRVL